VGFNTLINSLIAGVANPLTKSLQTKEVLHYRWQKQDGKGKVDEAPPIKHDAIVEMNPAVTYSSSEGSTLPVKLSILILQPFPPEGSPGRREPVDPRDRFVLPDGTTGKIVDLPGMLDPTTLRPYYCEVRLG
jgi:hypothetical protein